MFTFHQLELHLLLPTFIDAEQRRGNIKGNPASRKWIIITRNTDHFLFFIFLIQLLDQEIHSISFIKFNMASNASIHSDVDSDVFFVEQISTEPSPQRNNSPNILNSTEQSQTHTAGMPSISSIASPEPQVLTIHDDSNEPTMPYGSGRQLPIVQQSLNDLNLPPNPFKILAKMAVVNRTGDGNEDNYSPQSPEPSEPSPISTPPMNVSTFDSWEASYTTNGDDTFYSSDEPRRIYFLLPSPSSPPSPARKMKRKLEMRMSSPKRKGVSQHICEACGQTTPSAMDIPGPSNKN